VVKDVVGEVGWGGGFGMDNRWDGRMWGVFIIYFGRSVLGG
jgi:hypothetical protein